MKKLKIYRFSDGSAVYDDAFGMMANEHMLWHPEIRCVSVEDAELAAQSESEASAVNII